MTSLQHLLAATDLSPLSMHALDRGFQLARDQGARYTVLHALGLDAMCALRSLIGDQAEALTAKALAHQQAALAVLVGEAERHQGLVPTLLVEPGLPGRVIPEHAARGQVDLVLVGAKGDRTPQRLMVGSTAGRLLRKSPCPVLLVKRPGRAAYRRVLVAVDFSVTSLPALRLARLLAPQAQLVLFNACEVTFEGMLRYAGVADAEVQRYRAEARTRSLRGLQALADQAGLGPEQCVLVAEPGDAVHEILAQEARLQADLTVMGKHGTHVTEDLLLGSVTKRVLAESQGDMLVVSDQHLPVAGDAGANAGNVA